MKKISIFILCFLFAAIHQAGAQRATYSFSHRTETFVQIDAYPGVSVQPFGIAYLDNNITGALDPAFLVKNFKGFGYDIEKDPAIAPNFVYLHTANTDLDILTPRPVSDTTNFRIFRTIISAGFNMYCINDADTSRSIKMKNIFNASDNDTICIVQFSNVSPHDPSFLSDPYFGNGLSIYTFQIWIHSKDNSIEFKYGPRTIVDNPGFAPAINLHLASGTVGDDLYCVVGIRGNANSPTVYTQISLDGVSPLLNSWPPENMVYKFTPQAFPSAPTAIHSPGPDQVQADIYPNPVQESLHVTFSEPVTGEACLYNILGQKIIAETVKGSSSCTIACAGLSNGIYTVHFVSKDGLFQMKKQVVVHH